MAIYKTPKELLKKAIDSLLAQSLREIEILLIDDGCPIGSGIICDEYARLDSRIRVFHQSNKGMAAVWNFGMSQAKGDWILFYDSDDWGEITLCEDLLVFASKYNLDIALCASYGEDNGSSSIEMLFENTIPSLNQTQQQELMLKTMVLAAPDFSISVSSLVYASSIWSKLYKKSFLEKYNLNFGDTALCLDMIFNLQAFQSTKQIGFLGKPLYHYRKLSYSDSNRYRPDTYSAFIKVHCQCGKLLNDERLLQAWKNQWLHFLFSSIANDWFHKQNPDGLVEKIRKLRAFLALPENQKQLNAVDTQMLDGIGRKKYWLLKHKFYLLYYMLLQMRKR
jgi:glycosyltransferase involved in cell wall biosynthesis